MKYCPQCKMTRRYEFLKLNLKEGMPAWKVAELAGVHENTVYNWKVAFTKGGIEALADQSRAAKTHPNEYPREVKETIRAIRREGLERERRHLGPGVIARRLAKRYSIVASPSGIGKFLRHDGLIPKGKRRRPKKERADKCRIHEPGELLQMDVKYGVKNVAGCWFYEYDAIEYVTGIVLGEIYPIQSNYESVRFLEVVVRRSPFSVLGVQTDNHSTFTNYYTGYQKSSDPSHPRLHAFDLACARNDIIHYLIDKGKPAQNGKIERFHLTAENDFWQQETFTDLNSVKRKFRDFLHYHNNERENQANDYLTPLEKLRTFPKYAKIKEIVN
ncbi:MAG: DDE-type integrase/transposase/recombinase [Candidatus Spechtbacteria bacterium]|nr:DDE-type integrase/transposase/recombinase [Candidatus Spechtbacteria bacterium]